MEIKKGTCPTCGLGCHTRVHIQDGEIVKITGDPSSSRGKNLCEKSIAGVDFHYHPGRINYPLKRVGQRGGGRWERISWKAAVDEITQKLDGIRTGFGPEAVAALGGGNTTMAAALLEKWCNLWGTPNYFWQGKNCGESEFIAESAIYGYITALCPPLAGITKCAIVWGENPWASWANQIWPTYLPAKKAGMKMVVVDPRLSETAQEADIWVQLRPGTDGALALGMLNVIISEELYDKEFVDRWCLGFDELKALVQRYPVDKVSSITWVPREQIVEVARLYATSKPALLTWGVAQCQVGHGAGLSAVVGKSLLRAITGNLDVEGGNAFKANPDTTAYLEELHWDKLIDHPLRMRDNVSADIWPIASVKSLKLFREAQSKVYPRGVGLCSYYFFPGSRYIWSAILEEDPYPIKSLLLAASNPLVSLGNAKRIYRALKSPNLELFVAVERWMTPSAQMADYVLPSADPLEYPYLADLSGFSNDYFGRGQAVDPLYERKADYYIWRKLGIHLGQEAYWPETLEQWYDKILEPINVSFEELETGEVPGITPPLEYKAYEKKGFATFSGKVELSSSIFEKLGCVALPDYEEPSWSPLSTPDLAEEYPLILISGARVRNFWHTQHRQIDKLRKKRPYPLLQIHPETAQRLGVADGDPVYIETPLGKIRQRAKLTTGIDPRVVHADAFWWYPELPGEDPSLFGVWDSNINAILPDAPELCDYTGDNYFRALLCKVYRAKEL